MRSSNNEIERKFIEEGYFTKANYPITIKPNFSTLRSIIEISPNTTGSKIEFTTDDSVRDLSGFEPVIIHEEYNLSDTHVDNLSFDKFFLHCDIAQCAIFEGKPYGIINNFTLDVNFGCKNLEKVRGNIQWYMII